MAMIADLYPTRQRATAVSVFYLASPIGASSAYAFGGWIAGHYGWPAAFLVAAVPGMLLALLVLFTVKEPSRESFGALTKAPLLPVWQLLRFFGSI